MSYPKPYFPTDAEIAALEASQEAFRRKTYKNIMRSFVFAFRNHLEILEELIAEVKAWQEQAHE